MSTAEGPDGDRAADRREVLLDDLAATRRRAGSTLSELGNRASADRVKQQAKYELQRGTNQAAARGRAMWTNLSAMAKQHPRATAGVAAGVLALVALGRSR